ncbi:protein ACCELERATED CELL DEATH 6-like isoform X2 [Quercus robur]|uniref:protein ACCELERATED CELL DEATH 6-like isoform X2 n=1 Tax=Quercus robur TaxID=38942 RepID=UPI0021631652|nr:protein ACCELERATED CELL DEATH 6-like isoform X2 [Quercus robur]
MKTQHNDVWGLPLILEKLRDAECSLLRETRFFDSNTLLHVAASLGHDQIVGAILSKQQCQELLTAKNSSGDLPLHVAVNAGHLPVVQQLLKSSDQCEELLTAKNSSGDLPLHVAVNAGHLPIVKQLLKSSSCSCKLLKEENKEGKTPLHLALIKKCIRSEYKYIEVAKLLIETGREAEDGELMEFESGFDYESWRKKRVRKFRRFVQHAAIDCDAEMKKFSINSRKPELERGLQKSKDKVTSMDPILYKAVMSKDIDFIKKSALDTEHPTLSYKTTELNTILHLAAASSDNNQFVQEILGIQPCQEFVTEKNSNGDLPLHVAASAGNKQIVELLAANVPLIMEKNMEGNTPLHLALIKKFQVGPNLALKAEYNKVARFLVDKCPDVSFYPNRERKSPLYLAAEGGDEELMRHMITTNRLPDCKSFVHAAIYYLMTTTNLPYGKSIAHAAIYGSFTARKQDILDTVLESLPNFILEVLKDDEGMTPLMYAASIGYLRGVESLLGTSTIPCVYGEHTRYYPIHIATWKGHIKVVEKFLHEYPDMIELLTAAGQNILHVAAMNGKAKMVAYMLKRHDLKVEMLINHKDRNGNTPLHLAAMRRHPMVVSILTWDKRVDFKALNKEGKRALDIALNYRGRNPSFRQRLTWEALRYVSGPQAPPRRDSGENTQCSKVGMTLSTDQYKERTGTLLLVATLVSTVTFAAAFTMPGGYKESGGMAKFLEKPMFHVFVISNFIAMYSAITAVVTLLWAHLDDLNLFIAAYKFSVPILGLAITMVSLAFMAGNYLVLRDHNWLAYLVLSIGSFFLFTLSIIFFPLCLPNSSPHPVIRYILRYQFRLLIKFAGCESCDTDDFDEWCDTDDSEEA